MSNYRETKPIGLCAHHLSVIDAAGETHITTRKESLSAAAGSPDANRFHRVATAHNNAEDHLSLSLDYDGQRGGRDLLGKVVSTNLALPPEVREANHEVHTTEKISGYPTDGGFLGWLWLWVYDPYR